MIKKKGEKASEKEGANSQTSCSAKDKGSQAAAILEKFAHTQAKSNQIASQAKDQVGVLVTRKSQGQQKTNAGTEVIVAMENSMQPLEAGVVGGEEPSLKEILQAVNFCKSSLSEMIEQVKGIREEITFLRHDI